MPQHRSVLDYPIPPPGSLESVHVLSTVFSQTSLQSLATPSTPPPAAYSDLAVAVAAPQRCSPVKFKQRPGPRKKLIEAATRWFPPPTAAPSRAKRGRIVEFKLGVLSWAHHALVDDERNRGTRPPTREEVRKRFGMKNISQISRLGREEASLLKACEKNQRIRRRSNPRWKNLRRR